MTKKHPSVMTEAEMVAELGDDEVAEIRKRLLANLYEQKMKESTIGK